MSIFTRENPVFGNRPSTALDPAAWPSSIERHHSRIRDARHPDEGLEDNDFGRLARLVRSNEQLLERLGATSNRLRVIRSYLGRSDANVVLGRACYRHWRAEHSCVLAMLRANRLEARGLLSRLDPGLIEDGPSVRRGVARRAEPVDSRTSKT